MSCLFREVGSFAISLTNPAGANPREGAAFSLAQIELDKLNNIHAESGVDWQKVADACVKVLREEGKDFNAAVWLLCAWTTLQGVSGLANGLHILREMLELYWETLTPPPARLRARRNQAEWMLEWLAVKLEGSFEPVPGEQLAGLLEDWDAIDSHWRDRDADGPSFFALRRRLSQLPVQASVEPIAVAAQEVLPAADAVAAIPTQVAQAPSASTLVLAPVKLLGGLESDEAIENAVNTVFASLAPLLGFCLGSRATLPLMFRLNRQSAWTTLEQAPLAQGYTTRVPPPSDAELEAFSRLQSVGDPLDIVRFCEGRLASYPFWLDLNRASHAALSRLGSEALAAAASVALGTHYFLARLPTLVELTFADGQPFADGATRSWLEGLAPATSSATDGLQTLIDEVGRDAAQGRLNEALARLQSAVRAVGSDRERFRLRAAQCHLLHRFDPRAQLRVALDVLLQEATEQGLDRWEPELVRPLLELALAHDDGGSRALWAQQLAAMDLPAFWRLASPQAS
ncbi:type VI secretion system protein TssA [Pseudomonas sp. CCI1.2]|uniref:type VI secretion system protein TssA n=1 Tax=Pseudomonas sp. CCI1.2 TaxID=3048614 RepID=UPI002B2285E3|nr:type VI secretion system protein TssA [Pseudomonas sp. CCI1.2]MEB0123211.1 type VI secretion system protein TssA [Pseudomonas sp. CCI1.2]